MTSPTIMPGEPDFSSPRPLAQLLWHNVTEAIIGLVGVVVGGLLTGAVESFAEWRRERAALQAARRLLHLELLAAEWVLSTALQDDDVGRLKGAVPTARWSEFSALMAKNADPDVWRKLSGAFGPLSSLRADAEFMESRALLPAEREAFGAYLAAVQDAEKALRNEALELKSGPTAIQA